MSDPVRTDRDRTPSQGLPGPSPSFLRRLAGQILDPGGTDGSESTATGAQQPPGIRFDKPHESASVRSNWSAASLKDVTAASAGAANTASSAAAPFSSNEEEVLRQTSQIALHLRTEREELERREGTLQEQHALLDKEWRSARLWVHEFEEELVQRQADLKSRESGLNEKIGDCERLVSELEEQERLVLGLRDQMSTERANLRSVVDRELEIERLALHQTRQALDEERRALAVEIEKRRREQDELMRSAHARVDAERMALKAQLGVQLEADRAAFERERDEWNVRRTAEQEELRNQREISATASQMAQDELLSHRRREFDELRLERETLEAQLAAERRTVEEERQKLEQGRQRLSDELADLKRMQVDEIERERARVREEIETARGELDAVRGRIEEDLKRRVEERERSLRDEQKKLEEQHREQLGRLEQERNLLENRIRFQQEHLQKARQEVEAAQHELRRQHQSDRADLEQRESVWRMRRAQLAHVRLLIEEREHSLAREQAVLSDGRQTVEADLQARADALSRDQTAWEQEREAREAELRKHAETLATENERLESRRQRLEGLRIELEETHRRTLEMRMAIEEVWAQLSQEAGAENAKRRLAETQRIVEGHSQQIRETIAGERRELVELHASIQSQKTAIEQDRAETLQAADKRQAAFDSQRNRLAKDVATLRTREDEINALRREWVEEKLEVEQIIRGLLVQLSQQAQQSLDTEAPSKP